MLAEACKLCVTRASGAKRRGLVAALTDVYLHGLRIQPCSERDLGAFSPPLRPPPREEPASQPLAAPERAPPPGGRCRRERSHRGTRRQPGATEAGFPAGSDSVSVFYELSKAVSRCFVLLPEMMTVWVS